MSLTGGRDGEPQRMGWAFDDIFTGVDGVIGIQAALRQRDMTGQGAHVDMALLDTQVSVLANQALNYLVSGKAPTRLGNAHPNIVPYQLFPTADGHAIIACGNDREFVALCRVLGLDGLAQAPDSPTNPAPPPHPAPPGPLLSPPIVRATLPRPTPPHAAATAPATPVLHQAAAPDAADRRAPAVVL